MSTFKRSRVHIPGREKEIREMDNFEAALLNTTADPLPEASEPVTKGHRMADGTLVSHAPGLNTSMDNFESALDGFAAMQTYRPSPNPLADQVITRNLAEVNEARRKRGMKELLMSDVVPPMRGGVPVVDGVRTPTGEIVSARNKYPMF